MSSAIAQSLVAWAGLPLLLALVSLGLGLLVERLLRIELPSWGLAGPGFALAVLLTYATYRLGGTASLALPALLLLVLAGWLLGWRSARARLRPGPLGLVALGAYVLVLTPVLLTGRWTWTGYNFVNDTSIQFLLAEHLPRHGFDPVPGPRSTRTITLQGYLDTAYPAGSHAVLGTLDRLVPGPLAALYQPYLGALVALLGVSLGGLARRAGASARWVVAAGLGAAGANLFYQYALQGNVKEVAFAALLAAATALAYEVLLARRPERAVVPLALCAASGFLVYSAAALPSLAALAGTLVLAVLVHRSRSRARRVPGVRRLAVAGVVGAVVWVALASPGLGTAAKFTRIAQSNFASARQAADLGHLARPLPRVQASGVWLKGDYRFPLQAGAAVNAALAGFVLVLAALGLLLALRRREVVPLLALGPAVATVVLLVPRLSPYAAGKVLAIASPFVVLGAVLGARALARRWKWAGALAAAVALAGVAASDALAYREVRLAPVERLDALHEIAAPYAGTRGLVVANEAEEFAKNVMPPARMNVQSDAATVLWPDLVAKGFNPQRYFDWDDQRMPLPSVYSAVVSRRSPEASRPPSDFAFDRANRWYEAFRRKGGPQVLRRLPLQRAGDAAAPASCAAVRAFVRGAPRSAELVAASRPPLELLLPRAARRSPGWLPAGDPTRVVPSGPGYARGLRRFAGGRYRVWVAGTFGRAVHVTLDGRRVAAVRGVDTLGQWTEAAVLEVPAGPHRIGLERDGGNLRPGDSYEGEIGPLAFQADEPGRLVRRPLARWRSLCGKRWDWIELVRRSG